MLNVGKEVVALSRMAVKDLQGRYAEVYGDETKTANKAWLVKRIAWRLQALEEGDLSERARRRAEELANDADLRLSPPKAKPVPIAAPTALRTTHDQRVPLAGTVITREYKGRTLQVQVVPGGFEYEGETYKSLSAVAKAISGKFDRMVRDGVVADYAEIARLGRVSRTRISQITNLVLLAPDIQEEILFLPRIERGPSGGAALAATR